MVNGIDARHVARACPALQLAAVVLRKAREAAVGYRGLDARIKGGAEHGVVTAQRVAEAADTFAIHFGQRLQQIDGAHVVPDRLHATALEFAVHEIVLVIAKARIVRRERHITALGKMHRVAHAFAITQAGRLALADLGGLVQAEYAKSAEKIRKIAKPAQAYQRMPILSLISPSALFACSARHVL